MGKYILALLLLLSGTTAAWKTPLLHVDRWEQHHPYRPSESILVRKRTTLEEQAHLRRSKLESVPKPHSNTRSAAVGVMYEGWQAPAYWGRGTQGLTVEGVLQSNGTLKVSDMEKGIYCLII